MEGMCALAKVSRAGFYRHPADAPRADRDRVLRDALQRVALEFPSYGRPRMTAGADAARLGRESQAPLPADAPG